MNNHQFALYCADLSTLLAQSKNTNALVITDPVLVHRIKHVLRFQQHDECIFFDDARSVNCKIVDLEHKSHIICAITSVHIHAQLKPSITVLLPLLKKEALEQALYSCVELGAHTIVLTLMQKVQRSWGGDKELSRLRNIMIAAAEQSKNFTIPTLSIPIPLEQAFKQLPAETYKVCATVNGQPLLTTMLELQKEEPKSLALLVGPEGDLTAQEYTLLEQHHFLPCSLTPTVLRSQQALAVLLGALRSLRN